MQQRGGKRNPFAEPQRKRHRHRATNRMGTMTAASHEEQCNPRGSPMKNTSRRRTNTATGRGRCHWVRSGATRYREVPCTTVECSTVSHGAPLCCAVLRPNETAIQQR
eukprot:5153887-Alexandrium_andersonii.AAC.1